ncbi:helix-turn-helix domain-containing protein [Actinocorallia longicatena]
MSERAAGIEVSPLISEIAGGLLEAVEGLADDVFATIVVEDSFYAGLGPERRADVRAFNGQILREQLTCLARGLPIGTESSRENARRRAAQGVPIGTLLHAYRIGYRLLCEAMIARARLLDGMTFDAIAALTMTIWALCDASSQTVNEVYRDTLIDLARDDERQRLALLDALFEGRTADWSLLGGTAAAIGLPDHGPYLCAVADRRDSPGLEHALHHHGLRSVWRPRAGHLAGIIALTGGQPPAQVTGILDLASSGRTGISPHYEGLRETAEALRLAELARAALPPEARGATTLEVDPAAALVVASTDLAARLSGTVLGALTTHPDHDALLEVLTAWLETGGSTTEVAARLFCHRNTVRNRLDRIASLTGRSLDHPRDIAALYAAVRSVRLRLS